MLGKIRALTLMGHPLEAIETADVLLAQNWFVGDARYWRTALSTSPKLDATTRWSDIEAAGRLVVNADVPKLAGLIAYRRRELEVSRDRFQLSLTRNKDDCETYSISAWCSPNSRPGSAPPRCWLTPRNACKRTRNGSSPRSNRSARQPIRPARKESKIKRREQYIAKGRRQIATLFFNVAVAS